MKALAGSVPSSASVAPPLNEITSPARKLTPSWGVRIVAVGAPPTLIVIGAASTVLTPSETESLAVYWPAWVYTCDGFGGGRRSAVAERPRIGEWPPSGSADPALEKFTVSGFGPARGVGRALGDRRLIRIRVPNPADLAHAELPSGVVEADVDVVERSIGPFLRSTMSPYGPSSVPSRGSKLKTPVTFPLASNVRRRIQFCV